MATLFQRSTIGALLAGIFDGDESVGELLKRGDFGLGTFNALDGEMVVLDGSCYHIRSDGSAEVADASNHTPFAAVTRFTAAHRFTVEDPTTRADLSRRIDEAGRSANITIAVRIAGRFSSITTRTVSAQTKPYPSLEEASRNETEIELRGVEGTLVGFRTPEFEHSIGVAGYHLHFLDSTRTRGGHMLDFTLAHGEVELMELTEIHLSLPTSGAFLTADLDPEDGAAQIRHAEGN
ncbi:MAG: acetolactate decarboxylase [Actinomycetota bacterium]|jgi:acetolactate decarboxylase|nr:acetolactate decarboxylase [Actinomycetota bacterium]